MKGIVNNSKSMQPNPAAGTIPGQGYQPAPDAQPQTGRRTKGYFYAQNTVTPTNNSNMVPTGQPMGNMPSGKREYVIPWLNEKMLNPTPPSTSYFRFSSQAFPRTKALFDTLKVPIGAVIRPADVSNQPVYDKRGATRICCLKCGCMLCPQVKFNNEHSKWICPACKTLNPIEGTIFEAPELTQQVYDVIVPPYTNSMRNSQPVFTFILDLSFQSISCGITEQFIYSLQSALSSMPQNARVNLMTISDKLTYFDFHNHEELIFPDLKEPIKSPPVQHTIGEVRSDFEAALQLILERIHNTQPPQGHCLGNAFDFAASFMMFTGGIIIAVYSGIPKYGPYILEDRSLNYTEESKVLRLPENDTAKFWRDIAFCFNRNGISLHVFTAGPHYADLATDAVATGLTSGSCFHYHNFTTESCLQLHNDLFRLLTKDYLWDAQVSIKIPPAAKVSRFHGNCVQRKTITQGATFCAMQPDDSVVVEFDYDDTALIDEFFVQIQLSFTGTDEISRIRVFSFSLPTATDNTQIRQTLDESVLMGMLIRRATTQVLSKSTNDCQLSARKVMQDLRGTNASVVSLPYLMHSLLCNELLMSKHPGGIDGRLSNVIKIRSIDIISLLLYLYPRFIAVNPDATTVILSLSKSSLQQCFIVVLHCVDKIYIWLSNYVSEEYLSNALGIQSYQELPQSVNDLPQNGTDLNNKLHELINESRNLSGCYLPIQIVSQIRQEDRILDPIFVDDIKGYGMDYSEYIYSF
ncbi:Sec23/Sec24 trunk domain containing protein [Trichomonas vaginalis G3]|uniref:Sec23/Sec24 trunk domain containing protein n=1 Tax=Trichomonas vaginalis (strain ATCC PRA-98 / G3) TaxID=412133 RepID=A2D7D8_TRIV3|nr:ER to Golgi vesicle-mediated transport [Trichomonas vaginalis G3]EAY23655.1 Sec23/Sec24 trunk domain containing protein [Trichomonas vaginalis G3]KAI5490147.1 ER to Golgi vesicle-mediated transport [Trichomonas vaginalis G3]|eukprot:XP_001276903.1 Sec23/Sec24 trunk domain containing protein [Trichomonas vaginalis G3]